MDRFIGLDDRGASCTFGVVGPSGRKLRHDVVETNGAALVQYVRSIHGLKHLCLEEVRRIAWLHEILSPHVKEEVVTGISRSRGQKRDARDAFRRAEELRTGSIKTSVFKAPGEFGRLRQVAWVHGMPVGDTVRVQSRLKAQYRARGVATPARPSTERGNGRPGWESCRRAIAGPRRSCTRSTRSCSYSRRKWRRSW